MHLEEGDDRSDVFLKPQVDHPVGLIQHQVATDVQSHYLLLQQVHQSTWRCHYNVTTPGGGMGRKGGRKWREGKGGREMEEGKEGENGGREREGGKGRVEERKREKKEYK